LNGQFLDVKKKSSVKSRGFDAVWIPSEHLVSSKRPFVTLLKLTTLYHTVAPRHLLSKYSLYLQVTCHCLAHNLSMNQTFTVTMIQCINCHALICISAGAVTTKTNLHVVT